MHCSTVVRRRRLPAIFATLVLAAASVATVASAAVNQPPTISGQPASVATVGAQYTFRPTASDPERKKLRFSIANKPVWASFSGSNGRLSGTPTTAHAGITYSSVTVSVSDGVTTVSLPAFSIGVQGAAGSNAAPVISGTPATSVTAGATYSFQPSASDANNDPLTFSVTNAPAWASFSTSTGRLSGTPTSSHVGTYSNIAISVSDGKATTALSAFAIAVNAPPNAAPAISGSPVTSVNAGTAYSFRPTASDADGDALTYSIANRPAWTVFNTATGQLSGTPTSAEVGVYSNVLIAVSDGKASTSLPAFSIAVTQVSSGAATLSWTAPTQNTDGSALTNLAGYRILYGTSPTSLSQTIQIANAGVTTAVVENLSPATYYFAVRAYSSAGTESVDSSLASKAVQ